MARLGTYLTYAVRSALRQPVFTGIMILTLAVGIGANTAMFATIRAALAIPDSFPEADRLVFAACTFNGRPNPMASAPDF